MRQHENQISRNDPVEHDDGAGDVASLSKKYNDEDENEADRSGQTEEEETKWDGDKR